MTDVNTVSVTVNGDARELPAGSTLGDLLAALGVPAEGVAVAVNLEVVPRGTLASHVLTSGDRIELVRAVGGG